jgi:acyl carrier protein
MTDPDSIRTTVYAYLEDVNPSIHDPENPLKEDSRLEFFIDSFEMVNLITYLQQTFQIKIQDGEATPANLGTVTAIVNFVSRKQTK